MNGAPPIPVMMPEEERVERLREQLSSEHGIAPQDVEVIRAPLRICPLGAHIDHQLGVVTGMTIDQSVLMAFAPTMDDFVHVRSRNFDQSIAFRMGDLPPYQPGDWGNYLRGAVFALQQDYVLNHGMVAVVESEMPVGGLSSSAAVTISYLLALEAVNQITLSPLDNVLMVSRTEQQYIGLKNGILDQTSILFSQPNCLTHIDCLENQVTQIDCNAQSDPYEILVVYSGVSESGGLMGTGYNNRVAECQEAAKYLLDTAGIEDAESRLCNVDEQIFKANGHLLPQTLHKRAAHFFGEMNRVREGTDAWQKGEISRFGSLMTASGESSVHLYECGCPQLITLYNILRDTAGVYGARFSGGGFRGNCIALIDPQARESIAEAVHTRYPTAHPAEAKRYSIHFCQSGGSATIIK
ncbi:GHMP kinase [Chloroflexi bacterium TSY]|nr:GHMP kinase [Chloroflexi bacterium TSY]